MDRNNPRVADLYTAYHPSVLHALQSIVIANDNRSSLTKIRCRVVNAIPRNEYSRNKDKIGQNSMICTR